MSDYFDAVDPARIRADYPIGRPFFEMAQSISADHLRAIQQQRFLTVVARGWEIPFYQRLWGTAGLEPGDISSLDDVDKLPVFSKTDLMESVERFPPFGDFHGMDLPVSNGPREQHPGAVLHTTSGTTGAPQPLFFGPRDRELQNLLLARAYRWQGLRDDDVVHSVYGFGMVNGGHYVREAVLHFTKALYLPAGTGLETPSIQQVDLMRYFGATALVGFADYLKRLAEVAVEQGLRPGLDLPVRMISGHIGLENRDHLSALWGGAEIFDWYGVGDTGTIAAEGTAHDGMTLWEDAHYVETLVPDHPTGASITQAAGEAGSLCVTVLFKDTIYPVIRFNTQDLTTLLPPSPDFPAFRRMSGFEGRADSMVKLRGINVYPSAIGALVADDRRLGGEFICRAHRIGSRDEMTVLIERTVEQAPSSELTTELTALFREKIGVALAVEVVGPGETAALTQIESRQKPIRLIDER